MCERCGYSFLVTLGLVFIGQVTFFIIFFCRSLTVEEFNGGLSCFGRKKICKISDHLAKANGADYFALKVCRELFLALQLLEGVLISGIHWFSKYYERNGPCKV